MNATTLPQIVNRDFTKPIKTLDEAKAFVQQLHDSDLFFHLEDDPASIILHATKKPLFTHKESALLRRRVAEMYSLNWGSLGLTCPIDYYLSHVNPLL